MLFRYSTVATILSVAAITASAQTIQRRASAINGGDPSQARCVVEVVVDGAAEVEIRGDTASLRNLKGQPPQWRRFECTGPMPMNPAGFRFRGIDGRGKQQLVQEPQGGGPAVIRIDDPDNGSEGYTFEIGWGAPVMPRGGPVTQTYPGPQYPPPGNPGPPVRDDRADNRMDNRPPGRFVTDDAVRVCQSYVRDRAGRQFGANDIVFRRTFMDDKPGRNDWVTGFFESRDRSGRPRNFQFSCSVNFDNGQVRSADIHPVANGQGVYGDQANGRLIQACEASVEQKLGRDGYRRIDFGSVNLDDRPGRNDRVNGAASVLERDRPVWFDFSCAVNLRDGTVLSADVNRR